jgi:hypothetical protein
MIKLDKAQMDAAREFANAAQATLAVEGRVHPPTMVSAAARMAGTYLFRSFDLDLPGLMPGQVVLSPGATEQSSVLIQVAAGILQRLGIKVDDGAAQRIAESQRSVRLEFLQTQRKLEPMFEPIQARHGLVYPNAAHAAAVATALLINHCSKALDPSIAFGIAVFGFIEGSKTAPDPVRRNASGDGIGRP